MGLIGICSEDNFLCHSLLFCHILESLQGITLTWPIYNSWLLEDIPGPWLLATLIKSLCFYALIESLCFSPPFHFPPRSWEWDESKWLINQTFARNSRFGTCVCYNLYLACTKVVCQIYWWPVVLMICQIHDKYNTDK